MMASIDEINFYTDTMIVQTILSNNSLSKTAGIEEMASELIGKVKEYVGSKIKSENIVGSVLNMLAPGALAIGLGAMGMPWIGALFGVAYRLFDIDISGILHSIWTSLKGLIGGDKKTTSAEVDSVVSSAVQAHNKPATEEEARAAETKVDAQLPALQSQLLRDARIVKLAMIEFDRINLQSIKVSSLQSTAGIGSAILSIFSGQKTTTVSILTRVLGWIFKVALASAGLMVVGDLINKYVLNKPSGLDPALPPVRISTQKKFPLQPSYKDIKKTSSWVENISNNESSIGNMIISFAKKVYQGLDGLDNIIEATAGFQVIKDRIVAYNQASSGDSLVYIPTKVFKSEKEIVDFFIDDVAENAK